MDKINIYVKPRMYRESRYSTLLAAAHQTGDFKCFRLDFEKRFDEIFEYSKCDALNTRGSHNEIIGNPFERDENVGDYEVSNPVLAFSECHFDKVGQMELECRQVASFCLSLMSSNTSFDSEYGMKPLSCTRYPFSFSQKASEKTKPVEDSTVNKIKNKGTVR